MERRIHMLVGNRQQRPVILGVDRAVINRKIGVHRVYDVLLRCKQGVGFADRRTSSDFHHIRLKGIPRSQRKFLPSISKNAVLDNQAPALTAEKPLRVVENIAPAGKGFLRFSSKDIPRDVNGKHRLRPCHIQLPEKFRVARCPGFLRIVPAPVQLFQVWIPRQGIIPHIFAEMGSLQFDILDFIRKFYPAFRRDDLTLFLVKGQRRRAGVKRPGNAVLHPF